MNKTPFALLEKSAAVAAPKKKQSLVTSALLGGIPIAGAAASGIHGGVADHGGSALGRLIQALGSANATGAGQLMGVNAGFGLTKSPIGALLGAILGGAGASAAAAGVGNKARSMIDDK